MACEDCDLLKAQIVAYQDEVRQLRQRFETDELKIRQLIEKVDAFVAKPIAENKHIKVLIDNICYKLEWRLERLDTRKWTIEWQLRDFETRLKKTAAKHGIKRLSSKPPRRKLKAMAPPGGSRTGP